jgi:hypothetical protein
LFILSLLSFVGFCRWSFLVIDPIEFFWMLRNLDKFWFRCILGIKIVSVSLEFLIISLLVRVPLLVIGVIELSWVELLPWLLLFLLIWRLRLVLLWLFSRLSHLLFFLLRRVHFFIELIHTIHISA